VQKNWPWAPAAALVVVVLAVTPAWGQRIRFTRPLLEGEEPADEESSKVAAQPPLKPQAAPPADARPAAPPAKNNVFDDPPQSSVASQIETFAPEEPIETPAPYFLEPDAAYPLYEVEPYGQPVYEPYAAPGWENSLAPWRPSWGMPSLGGLCCPRVPSLLRGLGAFGQYLYLRPRDTEIAFAVPGQGPIVMGGMPAPAVPQGQALVLDPDYSLGFRAGVFLPLDGCTSLQLAYSDFESDTQNGGRLSAQQINQNINFFPLLLHPRTILPNNATNVRAEGELDVDFEMIDLDTRVVLWDTGRLNLTGYGGARWAHLEQDVAVAYTVNGGTIVRINAEYDGLGPHFGLDGYGTVGCWGFGYYARSELSLLYGASRGEFRQFQQNNAANPQAFTNWKADRLSPLYEMELGFQWMDPHKHVRLSIGYLTSVWFNVISAEEVSQGLQGNEFDDLSDTITFDGLTARAEFRL
jgi:hypothetical protein